MKVLHIVGDSNYGGGAEIVLHIAKAAKNRGWDVDVLAVNPIFVRKLKGELLGVIYLNVIWRKINPVKDFVGLLRLYAFLRSNNYDLVHTHTSKAGLIGRIAARMADIPAIIHTVHGFAFHENSSAPKIFLFSLVERIAAKFCDRMITVSNFHREWALKLKICPESKIVAIQNGISPERVFSTITPKEVRKDMNIREDEIVILSFGRLALEKGLEDLVQSVALLGPESRDKVRVIIAGDGPLKSNLETQIQVLGLTSIVRLLGFRSDVGNLLAVSDIVILPSLREGLSISILESMAAAKAIIATAIGSNREVLSDGETALLVSPNSPKAIVEALQKLIIDKDLRTNLGNKAREILEKYYTEQRMSKEYIQIYENLYSQVQNRKQLLIGDHYDS